MKTRIYFLDNLRTFIILLVIVLHSAIAYTPFLESVWIVNDAQKGNYEGYVVIYLDIFVMFIMFFISGYFIPSSYKKRSLISFIGAKFKRIMVPWMVAVFVLIPVYKYIFLVSRGMPQQEWYSYFHIFARENGNMGFFADNPTQSWLWFLPVLFMFQVVYALLSRIRVFRIRMNLNLAINLVFWLSLVYSLSIASHDMNGWFTSPILHFQRERLFAYFLFFLLGSLCYKLNVFEAHRNRPVLHVLSLVLFGLSITTFTLLSDNYFANLMQPGRDQFLVSEAADGILYYTSQLLSVFTVLYVLLHFFRKFINRSGNLISELSRNSYSVYIIHMVIMGIISLPLLYVSMPVVLKMSIVALLTFIVSNLAVSGFRATLGRFTTNPAYSYAAVLLCLAISAMVYAGVGQSNQDLPQEKQVAQAPEISIHMAAIYGDTTAILRHMLAGTDINQKEPSAGSTPLISASLFGNTDVANMLINAGADINYQNNDGSTALHTAAFFCREDIVILLLENGADKNIRNKSGSTALESVLAPWEAVSGIYDYFTNSLGPLGLELDKDYLKEARPQLANTIVKFNE